MNGWTVKSCVGVHDLAMSLRFSMHSSPSDPFVAKPNMFEQGIQHVGVGGLGWLPMAFGLLCLVDPPPRLLHTKTFFSTDASVWGVA